MMRILLTLILLACACGHADDAPGWQTTESENKMPFDPDLAGATLDFTDGVTSVSANFLDNLVVNLEQPSEAIGLGVQDGNVCQFVADPANAFGDILVEVDAGFVPVDGEWTVGGDKLFNVDGGTGLTVEVRELDTLALGTPSRTFDASWAAGSIEFLVANDRYLAIIGNDSGAGADKLDLIDLDTDTLVGTLTLTGGFTAGGNRAVFGRAHIFVVTDTATATVYAVKLSDATVDTTWGTSGATALTYGMPNVVSIDDRYICMSLADDVELIDVTDGSSDITSAGLGTGTGGYAFLVGDGTVLLWQAAYLSRHVIADSALDQMWEVNALDPSVAAASPGQMDGRFLFVASISNRLHAYDVKTGAEYVLAGNILADTKIHSDGMRLVVATSSGAGDTYDGFAALHGPALQRRLRRIDHGGYGKTCYGDMPLVPADL